jgi:hypothetical protein
MKTLATAVLLSLCAAPLAGQGNLSTQGYGYPQGQLTTRSLSFGGGLAEVDPSSALNPAAIGRLATRTVLFQIEPEYRSVTSAANTERTTTARYPLISIGVPFGERWVTAVSAATLLDRSWSTATKRDIPIGSDQVETSLRESSNGAINDLRFAGAWTNHSTLFVGLGLHAFTGRNVVTSSESFADSSFSSFTSSRVLSYTGSGISAGVQLTSAEQGMTFGASFRKGGSLRVRAADSTVATGNVPDRFGVSLAYTGLPGTIIAARVSRDGWSSMSSMLSTATEKAHDAWDFGGGIEATGPRLIGQTLLLRGGGRTRTLPFEASGKVVTERSLTAGAGTHFGGGRMTADVAATRQWRTAGVPSVKERAWTLSLSLTARP